MLTFKASQFKWSDRVMKASMSSLGLTERPASFLIRSEKAERCFMFELENPKGKKWLYKPVDTISAISDIRLEIL